MRTILVAIVAILVMQPAAGALAALSAPVAAPAPDAFDAARDALALGASDASLAAALAGLDLAASDDPLAAIDALLAAHAKSAPRLPTERFARASDLLSAARASDETLADGAALARSFADAFGDGSPETLASLAALDTLAAMNGERLGPARALAIAARTEATLGISDPSTVDALLALVASEPGADALPEEHARYALALAKARAGPSADDGRWERARDVLNAGVALRDAKARGASVVEQLDLALAVQAAPESFTPVPSLALFGGFAAAVDALHLLYGQSAPEEMRAAAARIDAEAPAVGAALARIVAAHMLAEQVAASGLIAGDAGLMIATRDVVAREIAASLAGVGCIGFPIPPNNVLIADLVCEDDTYTSTDTARLTIDAGGNDAYFNDAAGASGSTAVTVIDLDGDDLYAGSNAFGQATGIGTLIDFAGNDLYLGGNAQADGGSALLLDANGDDEYWGGNAYAAPPFSDVSATGSDLSYSEALLVDLGGNDRYMGKNGVAYHERQARGGSHAALVDAGGDDTYEGGNGAATAGAYDHTTDAEGLLLDMDGDDAYSGNSGGRWWGLANGAGLCALGALVDFEGNDSYDGRTAASSNAAGFWGAGFLLDLTGDETYQGGNADANALLNPALQLPGFSRYIDDMSCGLRAPTALLFDGAGSDAYTSSSYAGNAGAIGGFAMSASAFLYDASGDDTYAASVGSARVMNGAGLDHGIGSLLDLDGDDTYLAPLIYGGLPMWPLGGPPSWTPPRVAPHSPFLVANGAGGGTSGGGVLYDGGGTHTITAAGGLGALNGAAIAEDVTEDAAAGALFLEGSGTTYAELGTGAANGAARTGAGLLYQGTGSSATFDASFVNEGAANGAATTGSALLVSLADSSTFEATADRLLAANGGAQAGTAFLVNAGSGNSCYTASTMPGFLAANGGGAAGAGFLLDVSGDDCYHAESGRVAAANGGGYLGAGMLVDLAGADVYFGKAGLFGGLNGGGQAGVGMILDRAGDDTYDAVLGGAGGANGGATTGGIGLLLDGADSNSFTASGVGATGLNGAARGYPFLDGAVLTGGSETPTTVPLPGGIGVLLGGSGDDSYVSNGVSQGAGDMYGLGVLIDTGGANTYEALGDALAQGAGRLGGLGLLLDRGAGSAFALRDTAIGQGAGLQGIGLLLQGTIDAVTTYEASPGASPSVETGGGLGLRVAQGASTLLGQLPSFLCRDSPELREISESAGGRDVEVHVCHVDESTKERLRNPATGDELADVAKPPVPCSSLAPCALVVGMIFGPDAIGWLEAPSVTPTTSGGLLYLGDLNVLRSRYTFQSGDDTCRFACAIIEDIPT